MAVSIIQILRAVGRGECYLLTLPPLDFCCDSSGEPLYSVGNSAVLFRAHFEGHLCCVKCYTSRSPYRAAIYGERLHQGELYVPLAGDRGEWIDVVIDPWVEGQTLGEAIDQAARASDQVALAELSAAFDRLAFEQLCSEWAHGDITCDNIIVGEDGRLHLIDFDATFLPQFEGRESVELGTSAFRHPTRTIANFDRTIDDYSIALISTALAALALDASLYGQAKFAEGLLYDPCEAVDQSSSLVDASLELFARSGKPFTYAVARQLFSPTLSLPELLPLLRFKIEGVHAAAAPTKIFCRNGRWGYLNDFEREVIPPIFDQAFGFREGVARVRLGEVWHRIDSRARIIDPAIF